MDLNAVCEIRVCLRVKCLLGLDDYNVLTVVHFHFEVRNSPLVVSISCKSLVIGLMETGLSSDWSKVALPIIIGGVLHLKLSSGTWLTVSLTQSTVPQ